MPGAFSHHHTLTLTALLFHVKIPRRSRCVACHRRIEIETCTHADDAARCGRCCLYCVLCVGRHCRVSGEATLTDHGTVSISPRDTRSGRAGTGWHEHDKAGGPSVLIAPRRARLRLSRIAVDATRTRPLPCHAGTSAHARARRVSTCGDGSYWYCKRQRLNCDGCYGTGEPTGPSGEFCVATLRSSKFNRGVLGFGTCSRRRGRWFCLQRAGRFGASNIHSILRTSVFLLGLVLGRNQMAHVM